MDEQSLLWVFQGAVLTALTHTVVGVDHYLPLILLGRAEGMEQKRLLRWTVLCGALHVLSALLIGFAVKAVSDSVSLHASIESGRAMFASGLLTATGLTMFGLGLFARKRSGAKSGVLLPTGRRFPFSIAAMGLVLLLGPCEPLIPLVFASPSAHSPTVILLALLMFSMVTIGSMVILVMLGNYGLNRISLGYLERNRHLVAGAATAALGITFFIRML